MKPSADLVAKVSNEGYLRLTVQPSGVQMLYDPVATAMWVTLCMNHWNLLDAAEYLSDLWEVELASTYRDMQDWVADLLGVGILSV